MTVCSGTGRLGQSSGARNVRYPYRQRIVAWWLTMLQARHTATAAHTQHTQTQTQTHTQHAREAQPQPRNSPHWKSAHTQSTTTQRLRHLQNRTGLPHQLNDHGFQSGGAANREDSGCRINARSNAVSTQRSRVSRRHHQTPHRCMTSS